MHITTTKGHGVTVFTLTSDPDSLCPPLCQLLKGFCYSPRCCTVSQQLRKIQGTTQTLLGALQIVVGLLHIGLGTVFTVNVSPDVFPFWLGGMFILFGVMCILSERHPSPWLVILTVVLNLTGVLFAIAAIILYSLNLPRDYFSWMCSNDDYFEYPPHYDDTTPTPHEPKIREKCFDVQEVAEALTKGLLGLLIVLSVLELCIVISSAVLGIKSLRRSAKGNSESPEDPEDDKNLLPEVISCPSA